MSRVFIVGSAAVGAATAGRLLQLGHQVTLVDGAAERLATLCGQGLDVRPSLDLDGEVESFVVLCLPACLVGDRYELGGVENGAAEIGLALAGGDAGVRHTVVVRSDVPPGTTEQLIRPLLESCSGKREGAQFGLAVSPETLAPRPGRPAITLIGARSQAVADQVRDLLQPLGRPGEEVRLFDDPATAELIKCTDSLFSPTKISFWQEIWEVCCALDLNPEQVAHAVAASAQASFSAIRDLRGGALDRGLRLPRDPRAFLGFAAELGLAPALLSAVIGVNTARDILEAVELNGLAAVTAIPRARAEPGLVPLAPPKPRVPLTPRPRIPRQTRFSGPPV